MFDFITSLLGKYVPIIHQEVSEYIYRVLPDGTVETVQAYQNWSSIDWGYILNAGFIFVTGIVIFSTLKLVVRGIFYDR